MVAFEGLIPTVVNEYPIPCRLRLICTNGAVQNSQNADRKGEYIRSFSQKLWAPIRV